MALRKDILLLMTAVVAVSLADVSHLGVEYLPPSDYMGDMYLPPAPRQSPRHRTASPAVRGFGQITGAYVSNGGFASPTSSYIPPRKHTYEAPISTYVPPRTASYDLPSREYIPPQSTSTGYANPVGGHVASKHSSYTKTNAGHQNSGGHGGHASSHEETGMPFDFAYAVKDAGYGTDFSHNAASDGNVVKGEYRVQLPDGRLQVVRYSADWDTGYHADISYEGEARFDTNTHTSHGGNKYPQPANNYRADTPSRGYSSPPSNTYLPSSVNYHPF